MIIMRAYYPCIAGMKCPQNASHKDFQETHYHHRRGHGNGGRAFRPRILINRNCEPHINYLSLHILSTFWSHCLFLRPCTEMLAVLVTEFTQRGNFCECDTFHIPEPLQFISTINVCKLIACSSCLAWKRAALKQLFPIPCEQDMHFPTKTLKSVYKFYSDTDTRFTLNSTITTIYSLGKS